MNKLASNLVILIILVFIIQFLKSSNILIISVFSHLFAFSISSLVTVAWQCYIIQDTLGEAGVRFVNFTSKGKYLLVIFLLNICLALNSGVYNETTFFDHSEIC